jgi:hypothetical protein
LSFGAGAGTSPPIMSVRITSRVWAISKHGGTELLMLLAIADFADHDGRAYPSVSTLARWCRMTDRNAVNLLAKLRDGGELEIQRNAGPRGTNRYRIVLADAQGVKRTSSPSTRPHLKLASPLDPEAGFTPEAHDTLKPGVAGGEVQGRKPLKPASPEPSLNRQEPPERVRARTSRQAKVPLPAAFAISDQVRAWAKAKGFDRLEAHREYFVLKAAANGYMYVDWDAAFKGAIRDDWAKLRTGSALPADDVFVGSM